MNTTPSLRIRIGRLAGTGLQFAKWITNTVVSFLFSPLFSLVAKWGYGSNISLRWGFLPVPVHYYSPIPDLQDLRRRNIWKRESSLAGIDFNIDGQVKELASLGESFGSECAWPITPDGDVRNFDLSGDNFSFGCAAALHTMIRKYRPKTIIEIGSGNSSKVIQAALTRNSNDGAIGTHVVIDPYPKQYIKNGAFKNLKLIPERVELTDPKLFEELEANDILFIDSSHVVRIGDDVNFLYLEILPRLRPGVLVHIHDITLPNEYPSAYANNEVFRQFWTEQYLLQAFLACNSAYTIKLGMHYLQKNHPEVVQRAFPSYNPSIHSLTSGSFWIQRVR